MAWRDDSFLLVHEGKRGDVPIGRIDRVLANGSVIESTRELASPAFIGSDDTLVYWTCVAGEDAYLYGLNPDLTERWKLSLGPRCPKGSPVLLDGGLLGIVVPEATGFTLKIYETSFSGLADEGWPAMAHDHRNTGWREIR